MVAGGVDARLAAGHDVGGGGAEEGGTGAFGDAPLGAGVREAGAAVVEDDRGAGEEAGDEEVPHHPAGRGVPEEPVLGAEVAVQAELFEVLDEDAALGLDDGLGQAGGAGGVEHPQGVVEGQVLEDGFRVGCRQRFPLQRALGGLAAEERDMDHRAESGQFAAEFGDRFPAVVLLAAVAVAVDGEQHDGLDLLEAVQDAAGAEVGGAGGPDPADGGGGEEGDDGLGDVREVAADAVARAYAEGAQFGGERADLPAQFGPGDGGGFVGLVDVEEGRFLRAGGRRAQGVFGVVDRGAGEPLGPGHRAVAQHARPGAREPHVEPFGDGLPEDLRLVDGPAVQGRVAAFGGGVVVFGCPGLEGGDPGSRDALRIRLPERLGVHGRHGRLPDCARRVRPARTGWGVRVTRLPRTMPCDRLPHQGAPHIVVVMKMWWRHG